MGLITEEILQALNGVEEYAIMGLTDIGKYLLANPVISIFLCLAFGYLIGKIKIKSFSVGATVGTLICGLLLSLALGGIGSYNIDGTIKTIFFSLFIFAIGYEVGPAFFQSLKTSGVKILILSVVFTVVAGVIAVVLFKVFNVSAGEAGGILAGALTQSAILGTADSTMKSLLSGDALSNAESQMAVAYALTYVFGTVGVVVFMKNIAPAMMGVKLQESTKNKIEKSNFKETSSGPNIISTLKSRAFIVESDCDYIGKKIMI